MTDTSMDGWMPMSYVYEMGGPVYVSFMARKGTTERSATLSELVIGLKIYCIQRWTD